MDPEEEFWSAMNELADVLGEGDSDDLDDDVIANRTPGIRRALKALGRTKRSNRAKWKAGAKKGFKIGGKSVSRATFARKIGGVPKSYSENRRRGMDRTKMLEEIVANCGECTAEEFEGVSDAFVQAIHKSVTENKKAKEWERVFNSVNKAVGDGKLVLNSDGSIEAKQEDPPGTPPATPPADKPPEAVLNAEDKALLDWAKQERLKQVDEAVKAVVANQHNKFSEEELKAMPLSMLQKMAASQPPKATATYPGAGPEEAVGAGVFNAAENGLPESFGTGEDYLNL